MSSLRKSTEIAPSRTNLSRLSDASRENAHPKQHFIELDGFLVSKGKLYNAQLLENNWTDPKA